MVVICALAGLGLITFIGYPELSIWRLKKNITQALGQRNGAEYLLAWVDDNMKILSSAAEVAHANKECEWEVEEGRVDWGVLGFASPGVISVIIDGKSGRAKEVMFSHSSRIYVIVRLEPLPEKVDISNPDIAWQNKRIALFDLGPH